MDDADIVELYWQRDESAIRETETKYGQYCFSIAFNILSDTEDSKECVNDTWLRAWNAIPPSRPDRLRIFLAKITRNLSFDKYRLKAANKRGGGEITLALEELGECVSSALDVEFEFYEQELVKSLNGFLYALPKRESNIFLRRYFMPFYHFLVELPKNESEDGMKEYGSFYVPAVDERYISNMPLEKLNLLQ